MSGTARSAITPTFGQSTDAAAGRSALRLLAGRAFDRSPSRARRRQVPGPRPPRSAVCATFKGTSGASSSFCSQGLRASDPAGKSHQRRSEELRTMRPLHRERADRLASRRSPRREWRDHQAGGHGHTHGVIDPSIASSERGIWAIKSSFVVLAITAALQLAVVYVSGSVALLADTIHNIGDATTAIPLWSAFITGAPETIENFHLRARPGGGSRRHIRGSF